MASMHIHHIIPRHIAGEYYDLLRILDFKVDGDANLIKLPSTRELAAEVGKAAHTGRHLGSYGDGIRVTLNKIKAGLDKNDYSADAIARAASELATFQQRARDALDTQRLLPNSLLDHMSA
ncbi:MAG: hypothetical protein FIA96_11695 [Betaproteobacteria bacterium]|nr:hypothetical protein [Betaproteobacteria bacterium]